jgi:hypothetical protein
MSVIRNIIYIFTAKQRAADRPPALARPRTLYFLSWNCDDR